MIFARVPKIPGPVMEVYLGDKLFPMTAELAATWHQCPDGTTQGTIFDGVNYNAPVVPLATAQAAQIAALMASYNNAISQPVSYTSKGGVTKTYDADAASISNLQNCILGYTLAGATPAGFYWVAADNTQVPFTFLDLQSLAAAMMAQGWTAFQHSQTQKAAVNASVSVAAATAVVW